MTLTRSSVLDDLNALLTELREREGVPGVAVGIIVGDDAYVAGSGITSTEHPLPVDPDTLFQIGSVTKTFTATAAMRLVEAGRLALDSPVKTYLPDLRLSDPNATATVTLRHLLTHTAGFEGDDFSDTGWGDDALARYVAGMAELPQITPVGTLFSYCNSGFCLAGRVIEAVTRKSYEQALRELVLEPLGMDRAFLFPWDVMTHRFAVGHYLRDADAGVQVARPWPIPCASNAAGGITTSVRDLLKYARFVLARGAPLLRPDTYALMHTPQAEGATRQESVGLSWMLRRVGDVRLSLHGGGTNGQSCTLEIAPDRAFAIAVLTNGDRGHLVFDEVTRWACKQFLGVETPEPSLRQLSADELAPYVGRYETRLNTIDVSLEEGGLVAQVTPKGGFPTKDSPPRPPSPPSRVGFVGADEFLALDPPLKGGRGQFIRDDSGAIVWLRSGSRLARRQA